MAADHFCLRWNNYQSNMVSELDILRTEEHLVDVTLSCEGQKFRAHKVILSACSAYFRNVFKENPCEHPVVILKDVNCEDVEALLSFVYQGVVYVSEKKLSSFLQTAELLKIKGLTGAASNFKDENMSEKQATVPNKSAVPATKVGAIPSVSPPPTPPTKRRKGAPVRICKQSEEGEDSDSTSQRGEDDTDQVQVSVKQERANDLEERQMNDSQVTEEDASMEAEGEMDFHESTSNAFSAGEAPDGSEDGEVKREEATLLERQLVAASISRNFESQGQLLPFQTAGSMLPTNTQPLPEPVVPTGRGEWRCMQPQRCHLCHKVFSNSGNLRQHIGNMHMPRQCVPCLLCNRTFKNKEYLRKHHVQTHHAPLRRQRLSNQMSAQPCPLCPKIISNKSNLLKHMRIRHTDEYNPAYCMLCNKLFKNKYSLRAHVNIYHKFMLNNPAATAAQPSPQLPPTQQIPQLPPTQQQY